MWAGVLRAGSSGTMLWENGEGRVCEVKRENVEGVVRSVVERVVRSVMEGVVRSVMWRVEVLQSFEGSLTWWKVCDETSLGQH